MKDIILMSILVVIVGYLTIIVFQGNFDIPWFADEYYGGIVVPFIACVAALVLTIRKQLKIRKWKKKRNLLPPDHPLKNFDVSDYLDK